MFKIGDLVEVRNMGGVPTDYNKFFGVGIVIRQKTAKSPNNDRGYVDVFWTKRESEGRYYFSSLKCPPEIKKVNK